MTQRRRVPLDAMSHPLIGVKTTIVRAIKSHDHDHKRRLDNGADKTLYVLLVLHPSREQHERR